MKKQIEVTEELLASWKKEFGGFYELPVGDKVAYLKIPTMTDLKRGLRALTEDGEIAYSEEMLRALWLGGDNEIKELDEYFTPARKALKKLLEFEDAVIKKLDNRQSEITIKGFKCKLRYITRQDLQRAERENPSGKVFVTQEKLFEIVCIEKDAAFDNRNNASIRFPLYQALEELQNSKFTTLKKH